jgi:hypothetical protein
MKDALGHGSNGRGSMKKPLPGHPYHSKSDAELRYIIKDASEAGKNAQEMGSERGVSKYADQVNDAATILGYRARSGGQPEASNADAARALASGPKSKAAPIHGGMRNPADEFVVRNPRSGGRYGESEGF